MGLALLASCGGGDQDEQATATAERRTVHALAIAAPAASVWSPLIGLSLVPASAANLPNGKVLLWAANDRFSFGGTGQTYTSNFDPLTQTATEALVTQTGHDMFCSGTSNLPDGTLLINGGDDSAKTSLFNPATGAWTAGAAMNIARGYEGNTVLQDGSVLTLGGSWSGGQGNKNGEVWTAAAGWRRLSGVLSGVVEAPDPAGVYRGDNHLWLFAAPNGQVLHAGPSANMNWISTQGNGATTSAGLRGDDSYSQTGNAVMYDIGKILKTGGSTAYENRAASTASYVIDINAGVSVRKLAPMAYPRIFANGVVLPNGQVLVIGGQTIGKPFSDDNSVLVPELWDPATETFKQLPPIAVGRNYHSVALLLPDGRVLSGGGGLCGAGCAANHPDAQILTPHYLLNANGTAATRPVLQTAPSEATHGTTINVTTDSGVSSFALVRMSSTTHTVNNDQRRIPLQFTAAGGNGYALSLPSNPGVALPGYYMLFAMNADGVPSISKAIRITGNGAPVLTSPSAQYSVVGSPAQLTVAATGSGTLAFAALGLPPGLSINASSGVVSGIPTTAGQYTVTLSVSNAAATTSTNMSWRVDAAGSSAINYVKLEALSEINGNPWTSMAEFNLLDAGGAVMSRTGWSVSADSQEVSGENGVAARAVDGDPSTIWHTQWSPTSVPLPHSFTVNLGGARAVGGFKYLPRPGGGNGTIANWRFFTSADGITWTQVAQGTFANSAAEKTVMLAASPPANQPPTLAVVANVSGVVGQSATVNLSGNDPDGDALTYSATNLPAGMVLNTASGVISGTPTTTGTYTVTAQVSDGKGGTASRSFLWTITATGAASVGYVKLEALSEINGNPWTSMAEFNLLDAGGAVMSRTGWSVSADSQEVSGENGVAARAVDGDPSTIWHTQWSPTSVPLPHSFTVNLGGARAVGGFKYLPRPGGGNGTIANWRFFTSADGITWTQVAQGTFANSAAEKTVMLAP